MWSVDAEPGAGSAAPVSPVQPQRFRLQQLQLNGLQFLIGAENRDLIWGGLHLRDLFKKRRGRGGSLEVLEAVELLLGPGGNQVDSTRRDLLSGEEKC